MSLIYLAQNPIEQEHIPTSSIRSFMFVYLNYPSFEEEIEVVKLTTGKQKTH